MRTTHILILCLLMCILNALSLNAQTCGPEPEIDPGSFEGTAFFNYGSTTRSKSNTYKTAFALGQTFIGFTEGLDTNTNLGFYTRYFLPPFALKVHATQGDLLDRIQVNWEIDALGPAPNEGFNIYRDGIFLEAVAANIRSFNDFDVIPGTPYTYSVRGLNAFGEGVASDALGFQVPNGTVTGWISTLNGSPVPGATVTLTPMQGFSAKFDTGDGAIAMEETSTNPFLPGLDQDWTITFWIKTETTTNGKIMSMDSLSFRARSTPNGGIAIGKLINGGTPFLAADFPAGTKEDWHHIALTFDGNGNKYRLYFDGVLKGIATSNPVPPPDTLNFGALAGPGTWKGRLDEFRIYHHKLDELDFDIVMEGTASSETPYLTHYWKMDEELGEKSYDIVKRHKLYFCGADFDSDRPPVHTAGITNDDGYYKIESASYGTGTTFLATPKKNFYMHRALKFEKAENDYATLPDFAITKKATIELWVNSAGPDGFQCLLSKQFGTKEFRVVLDGSDGLNNYINVHLDGTTQSFTQPLGSGYQHLAFAWDSLSHTIKGYKNGVLLATLTLPATTGNWSDPTQPWFLGRRPIGASSILPFDGLIDEVAVYDTTLKVATILNHFQNSRNAQEKGLRIYFALDEGSGTNINNVGSILIGGGTTSGTEWSALANHQVIEPHVFTPITRQVTLNPSVTSVDQVDFTDRSTIPVTGYVRYKNTDCFANNVEILVNGLSFIPAIFTDTTGKFVIDLDPGTSAILTPKFEDHTFSPASWQVTNVSSPIAGIVFNDLTTRNLTVYVAGGECGRSLTTGGLTCVVRVSSADNCFSRDLTIPDNEKKVLFSDLPPKERLTVKVVEHSHQVIIDAFNVQGGLTIDLSKQNETIDFIYTAPPIVDILGLVPEQGCIPQVVVFDQGEPVQLDIKLKEVYPGGICEIDSASFHIINDIADEVLDTTMRNGLLEYDFKAGGPNPTPPFHKTIQFIAKTLNGVESSTTREVIVTGIKTNLATFTSMMPEIPTLILRDPPGDGSYSFLRKEEKICQTTEIVSELVNGGGGSLEVKLTPHINYLIAPLGFGTILLIDPHIGNEVEGLFSFKQLTSNSFETCLSFDEDISTSSDDLIVGGKKGADLYMGNAFNIIFGLADEVKFNNCMVSVDPVVQVQSGGIATTFIYSEFNIENNIIRYLDDLAKDGTTSDADSIQYEDSKERWEAILLKNKHLKDSAEFIRNISFDAGVNYEYSETSSVSNESSNETSIESDITNTVSFGVEFEGSGVTGELKFVNKTSNSTNESTSEEQGITTGYSLEDDDPLDQFTVDVKMDTVYKTPVFKIVSGQSSCPWEYGTANREGPNLKLAPGFDFVATNIPANEPAIFELILGNKSATHEDWTYVLTAIAANNPYGASIKMDGASLVGSLQKFIIPYGDSIRVTITIEKGPIEYTYDDLVVALVSQCEYEHNLELALPLDHDSRFYSELKLGAHFIRPCSEVNIIVPQQDEWVIKNNNPLKITASGYDLNEPNFKLMRFQYRPTGGDGAWINIAEKYNPKWLLYDPDEHGTDTLKDVFHDVFWGTIGLDDGLYEIRALTVCENAIPNNNGYSKILKGRIDRLPPGIVGVPEPSDGVYQQGDEISFTFNQPINCDKLNPVDDVHLYDGNEPIGIDITCYDNKIVIDPNEQNTFLENRFLKMKLDTVEDLTGNKFIGTTQNLGIWEFYVDRNELAWLTDSAGITKYADETKSLSVKMHNRGGYPVPFTIDAPHWVHVTPDAGTLVANEIREIQFTAGDTLEVEWFKDSITLTTENSGSSFFMGGVEKLPFDVRNMCRPPVWNVNTTLYQQTMTLCLRIKIDNGPFSSDPEDQIGAFIDGQLRGTAKLTQTNVPAPNTWVAFMTLYGNAGDAGKDVIFELFDADACLHYPARFSAGDTISFTENGTQGTPNSPRTLINTGLLIHEIPVKTGWNWISFNLGFPNAAINQVLNNIPNPSGDLIKNKTAFSSNVNNIWTGSLTTIGNESMYMYQSTKNNTIKITGNALTPPAPITLISGWNWISYTPDERIPINIALASISPAPTAGDVIKSQNAFAQYVNNTTKWIGSLTHLQAPNGYLMRSASGGTLTYPASFSGDDLPSRRIEPRSSYWNVDASKFEHNMTLIGVFEYDETNATTSGMELGAFVGNELRGAGEAVYVEFLDSYMFFLTTFANKSGEQVHFKIYDPATGEELELKEKMTFTPNLHQGSIEAPVPFTLHTTTVGDVQSELSFDVQPNPFRDETECRIELPIAQDVRLIITDMDGKVLYVNQLHASGGMNIFSWNGCTTAGTPLSNGIYLIRLETEQGILTKPVALQR